MDFEQRVSRQHIRWHMETCFAKFMDISRQECWEALKGKDAQAAVRAWFNTCSSTMIASTTFVLVQTCSTQPTRRHWA